MTQKSEVDDASQLTDEEIESCRDAGNRAYMRHRWSTRGQQITPRDSPDWHFARAVESAVLARAAVPAHLVQQPTSDVAKGDQAPPNNLPDWDDCALRVRNSEFIAKRVAEGGYGAEPDSLLATELHRFIYEYDDARPYRSAWFRHRLELVLNEAKALAAAPQAAVPAGWKLVPMEPTEEMVKAFQDGFIAELHQPEKRRTMTAEAAGLRAMLRAEARQEPKPDSSYPAQPTGDAATARDAARYEQDLWLRELFALIEKWRDTHDGTPSKAKAWSALWKHAHNLGPHWRAREFAALSSTPAQGDASGVALPADWLPTTENVNALPEPLRRYITDMETLCDPSGLVCANAQLKDCNEGLQRMYRKKADAMLTAEQIDRLDARHLGGFQTREKLHAFAKACVDTALNDGVAPAPAPAHQPYAIDGLVAAVAVGNNPEVAVMFDKPEQAHGFVNYLKRFIEPKRTGGVPVAGGDHAA